jgi:hypothetical protein
MKKNIISFFLIALYGFAFAAQELPQVYIDTTYSLPVGGTTYNCATAAEFSTALTNSVLGDVIVLTAGNTFQGPFTLPNKTSGSGWIYIVSSAYSSLPGPGKRVSIADAANMPTLTPAGAGGGRAITTDANAHHFRFIGIEIKPRSGEYNSNLVYIGEGDDSLASTIPGNIVFDRCYIHGDPTVGGTRGILMHGTDISVIDSYISDFKADGADTQALCSFRSPGPLKIFNNYLEAAGENVMFGGDSVISEDLIPSDIEIRNNHFFKPISWQGGSWVIKNLFESKTSKRVIIEHNTFENMWHSAQDFAVNLKSVNQYGGDTFNVTENITIRYNIFKNVGDGFSLAGDASEGGYTAQTPNNIDINNNLIILNTSLGDGRAFQIVSNPPIENLTINHNTVIGIDTFIVSFDASNGVGFSFINNILSSSQYGVKASGITEGTLSLNAAYPSSYTFTKNALIAEDGTYPSGNFYPANVAAIKFVDYTNGDYRLAADSDYKNAGTDGKDLGANLNSIFSTHSGDSPHTTVISVGGPHTWTLQ